MEEEESQLLHELIQALKEGTVHVIPAKPWQPWMTPFLENLERHNGNASAAIQMSPVCRDTVYQHRRRNAEFASRWAAVTTAARERNRRRRERLRRGGRCEE